ncbi:MAG: sigma-70 family RNA polymerase sigma factor [Acidimicrobiia bacterium]|nr:sigma-70 family RNA polymerase sigma factor [Acidimicrobiia bacterium]
MSDRLDRQWSIRTAASELPIREAEAIWLVDVCGCTYAQAAEEARTSPQTISSLVSRARPAIRRNMTKRIAIEESG